MRITTRVGLVALATLGALVASRPARGQASRAMASDCRHASADTPESRARAERWVRERLQAFAPTPEQALRVRSLEVQAEQVKLAFYGISSQCARYLDGSVEREVADRSLAGFERTIGNFLHDLGNEAVVLAAGGQVSDIGAIRGTMTDIAAAGRQAALMGDDEVAEEARRKLVDALVTFSRAFVGESCWQQRFPDELPYALQRQNDILGTEIDVLPCARRRFTAVTGSLVFESCTVRGVGDWRVRWATAGPMTDDGVGSGELAGEGDRAVGDYSADWGANGVQYRASGKMALARRDNGPAESAAYTLSGDWNMRLVKGKEIIRPFEQLMKRQVKPARSTFDVEVRVSELPCRSLDG